MDFGGLNLEVLAGVAFIMALLRSSSHASDELEDKTTRIIIENSRCFRCASQVQFQFPQLCHNSVVCCGGGGVVLARARNATMS
jgi:hypothetical protein